MLRWCHRLLRGPRRGPRRPVLRLRTEALEDRLLLSSTPLPAWEATPNHTLAHFGSLVPASSPAPVGFTPAQVRHAYGFDNVQGDGSGQTIAVIDAYDDPNIAFDLGQFDAAFGLPAPPSFTRVAQNGSSSYPTVDPNNSWELEESLDVEWAHAIAPGARLLLVEANSPALDDLNAAVNWARNQPGVSVVSMSYGGSEFSGESYYDGYYTTPAGHAGVTFVASAGDSGAPPEYPSVSPNVLAVGGTYLSLDSAGNYAGETGWNSGGGGISSYEGQPAYQHGVVTQSSTARTSPDVAFDAAPGSGVAVYDSYNYGTGSPWVRIGGTSLSAPCWAGLLAVANQERVLNNLAPLDGVGGTLPALYALPGSDFHDIASGNNGYPAGPGYDLVTGLGSPLADLVIADLAHIAPTPPSQPPHLVVTASAGSVTAGTPFSVTVGVLDAGNNPASNYTGTVHFTTSDPSGSVPADYTFTAADGGSHTFSGVVLRTAGTQTVTATDTTTASVTASTSVTVSPASLSSLTLSGYPSPIKAGLAGGVWVTARDAYGNLLSNYRGTIHFTSSDSRASLPADYTFTATDAGRHYFNNAVFKTAATQWLTATDRTGLAGTQSGIVVTPNAMNHLQVIAPTSVPAGATFSVTVIAQDNYNNTVTTYAGTVHFTSSDTKAGLPANYTFTTADAGKHPFSVTLRTTGTQSLTARDTVTGIGGTALFSVTAASPAFVPAAQPSSGSTATTSTPDQTLDVLFSDLRLLATEVRDWSVLGLTPRAKTTLTLEGS